MKRILMLLIAIALTICALTATISAEESNAEPIKYHLVQSLDSEAALKLIEAGEENIVAIDSLIGSTASGATSPFLGTFPDGSHIELVLAENIITSTSDNTGILINTAITVTVRYNGFTHFVSNSGRLNNFTLRHAGAKLCLYGTHGLDENGSTFSIDSEGKVTSTFKTPSVSNGVLTGESNVDIRHGKVYVWVFDGDVYAENMRTVTGEEFVYSENDDSSADTAVDNTYEFVNCASNSNSVAVGLQGKDNAKKTILTTNCYFSRFQGYTVLSGSMCTDTYFGKVEMDCWGITNQLWEFENCIIGQIATSSGRTYLQLTDCTFDLSKISLGSDGAGKSYMYVITSADCENASSKLVYLNGNMTGYADETYVPTPALGHSTTEPSDNDCTTISLCDRCKSTLPALDSEHKYIITAITYESYASKGVIVRNCSACASAEEKTSEAEEIIVALGYSTNGTDGIAGGYSINIEALEAYNEINPTKKLTFGVVMMNPYYLKDKDTFFTSSKVVNFDDLSKGAIQISMTTTSYSTLGFSIEGFEGYLAELELVISAYIYAEGDESVEFVQDQTTKCASKRVSKDVPLYTVTLNSVVAEANNSIAALDEYDYTLPSSKERE